MVHFRPEAVRDRVLPVYVAWDFLYLCSRELLEQEELIRLGYGGKDGFGERIR